MYNDYIPQNSYHAQGAAEIEMRVREQEKKMILMKAIYRSEANGETGKTQKKSRNPFRALLGIFLAGF